MRDVTALALVNWQREQDGRPPLDSVDELEPHNTARWRSRADAVLAAIRNNQA